MSGVTRISPNITLEQAVHSNTAIAEKIDNSTNDSDLISNAQFVAINCFEKAVVNFGLAKIWFDSFYRCIALNSEIGGAPSSQHCKFQAIDQYGKDGLSNCELFLWEKDNIEYDQLILEKKKGTDACWVHVSFSKTHNRKQVLIAKEVKKIVEGKEKLIVQYFPYTKELFNEIYPIHAI